MRRTFELRPCSLPGGPRGVEVLRADLRVSDERVRALGSVLHAGERARADRFRFEHDRRRFTVARGLLRELLGARLGLAPEGLRFRVGPHGKPILADDHPGIGFNVSHSGDLALFALADDGREVGVDLESAARLGDARDLAALAARTLTPADFIRWEALPPGERTGAFLRAWTRIEAYGKANGQGLGQVLGRIGVTFGAGEAARFLGDAAADPGWQLWDLPVGEGWAGALVVYSPSR